jgi:hypothetical protein
MIFLLATDGSLVMMLTEADATAMRPGRTLFVDDRQLKGATFRRIMLSLHPNVEAIYADLRRAGHGDKVNGSAFVTPEAKPEEGQCDACGGLMPKYMLDHDRCIVCWQNMAIRRMGESN